MTSRTKQWSSMLYSPRNRRQPPRCNILTLILAVKVAQVSPDPHGGGIKEVNPHHPQGSIVSPSNNEWLWQNLGWKNYNEWGKQPFSKSNILYIAHLGNIFWNNTVLEMTEQIGNRVWEGGSIGEDGYRDPYDDGTVQDLDSGARYKNLQHDKII